MTEYVTFWGIVCLAGFLWVNAILWCIVFPWMERILKVLGGDEDENS